MKNIRKRTFHYSFQLLLLTTLPITLSNELLASPDSQGEDFVIEAPWRTIREYLPVLFFLPDFENHSLHKIKALKLYNYDTYSQEKRIIFEDSRDGEDDRFNCEIEFIGPDGETRSNLSVNEEIDSFWHYVARVPVACIGFGDQLGRPGEHFLRGEIDWAQRIVLGNEQDFVDSKSSQVLRVIVTPDGFAKFSPVDHQFDVHVHTIAEQTSWHGAFNADASRKAFGGPLVMLMDSAYSLGMVDVQLKDGNWSDYKNKIVTTDHNAFFSGGDFDSGAEPGYGPTSQTNGELEEFQWYRDNLGALGGEEITLKGANGKPIKEIDIHVSNPFTGRWPPYGADTTNSFGLGSHFLSYGSPHFEGPWHGGQFVLTPLGDPGVENNITITNAIFHMGAHNGFGYASHPESGNFGWSQDYYERAIGLLPHNTGGASSPIVQQNGNDFVFKGLQIWNGHGDMKSRKSGDIALSESNKFDPYTPRDSGEVFEPNPSWRNGHIKTYKSYKKLLQRSLKYSFSHAKDHIFIRKLYLSAGTDSHGDFNRHLSIPATAIDEVGGQLGIDPKILSANNNAFGRMRTYTLTSQRYVRAGAEIPSDCRSFPFCGGAREAPNDYPLEDYKEGNTVATDGPVGRFSTDANCRFNSDIHQLAWHDALCIWENHDGMIGGRGKFDGGNTMLAPVGNPDVMMQYQWIGKNDYLPDSEASKGSMTFKLVRVNPNNSRMVDEDYGEFRPGRSGRTGTAEINDVLGSHARIEFPDKSALILEGQLSYPDRLPDPYWSIDPDRQEDPHETQFVTNPIWVAPYRISIDPVQTCPIQPGQLKVTVEFGISMNTKQPAGQAARLDPKAEAARLMLQKRGGAVAKLTPTTRISGMDSPIIDLNTPGTATETDADEKTYEGIRVVVKPLDRRGNSGNVQYEISGLNSQWQHVETPGELRPHRIMDAKYTTTNAMTIACGEGWNAANSKHNQDADWASYAIVVDQIYDMHMNYLNPIAETVSMQRPASLKDPIITQHPPDVVVVVNEKSCAASNIKLCRDWGASCEVIEPLRGAGKDLCRWSSANTASQCDRTVGIWTTAQSKYSTNHPKAVPAGASGACITQAANIKDRIN